MQQVTFTVEHRDLVVLASEALAAFMIEQDHEVSLGTVDGDGHLRATLFERLDDLCCLWPSTTTSDSGDPVLVASKASSHLP